MILCAEKQTLCAELLQLCALLNEICALSTKISANPSIATKTIPIPERSTNTHDRRFWPTSINKYYFTSTIHFNYVVGATKLEF